MYSNISSSLEGEDYIKDTIFHDQAEKLRQLEEVLKEKEEQLREKEQQLLEEEGQLREKEQQLREKEDQLQEKEEEMSRLSPSSVELQVIYCYINGQSQEIFKVKINFTLKGPSSEM